MKIFVTGATGFIGSAFCRLALSRGHDIAGLIQPTKIPPTDIPASEKMTWLEGTLGELPWKSIEQFQPDVCIHLAWIATPGVYLESSENERYLQWSLDLVRGLRRIGLSHIVGAGTCIEYQISEALLSEDHTLVNPTTLYARCKNALRETLASEAQKDGWQFCWGRVFYPYGVGEHPARLCSSLIQKLQRGETLTLKTPPQPEGLHLHRRPSPPRYCSRWKRNLPGQSTGEPVKEFPSVKSLTSRRRCWVVRN
ncbi:MAG: NAD-dependent epimerase/dehydratase family protein [Limisphaerales bacterium]